MSGFLSLSTLDVAVSMADNEGLKTILEDDLRSERFFAADRYPESVYTISRGFLAPGSGWID